MRASVFPNSADGKAAVHDVERVGLVPARRPVGAMLRFTCIGAVLRRAFAPTKKTGLLSETGLPALGYATQGKLVMP